MAEDISVLVMKVKSDGITAGATALNKLTTAADKAEKSVGKLGTTAALLNSQIQTGTGAVAAMQMAFMALTMAITAMQASQQRATVGQRAHNDSLREGHALARGLSGSFGALWLTYGNLAGMATGLALGAGLKGIVTVGSDVEHTLEKIRVLGESTTAQVNDMRQAIVTLGQGVQGPKDVAEAFSVLTLAGLSAEEAMQGVGAALNLAIAGDVSVEKASSTLVQVGTALGYTADSFNHVADVIAKTAAVSMSSVDSIAGAFKSAAAVGEVYGVSLQDIGVGLAAVANLGIHGTAAGTALKNMYKDLASQADKVTSTYKAMGMASADLKDDHGNFLPILEVIRKLDAGLKTLEPKLRGVALDKIAGERGVKEMAALIKMFNTASKEVDAFGNVYANKLEEVNDRIAKSYAFAALSAIAMSQTTKNQLVAVGNTLQTSFVKAFAEASPQINAVARALKEAFASPAFVNGMKAIAVAVADATVFLVDHIKQLAIAAAAYAAWKLTAFATGLVAVAQGLALSAAGAKAFAISLGPVAVAILAMGAAWAIYNANKDKSVTNAAGTTTLQDFTKQAIEAAEKESELIETRKKLRKEGLTQAEMAVREETELAKTAAAKAIEESARGVKAMKADIENKWVALNDYERKRATLIMGRGKDQSGIKSVDEYIEGTKRLSGAEIAHANNAKTNAIAVAKLIEVRTQSAEQAKEMAAEAQQRPGGNGTLGDPKGAAKQNAAYVDAMKALQRDIKDVYAGLRNEEEALNADFAAGKIGRIQLAEETAAKEIAASEAAIRVIKLQLALAKSKGDTGDVERLQDALERDKGNAAQAEIMRGKNVETELSRMRRASLDQEIKTLELRGEFQEAAALKFSEEHSKSWTAAQKDLDKYGDKFPEIGKYLASLKEQQKQAIGSASFKQALAGFDLAAAKVENTLKGVQTASENQGFTEMWNAANAASEEYKNSLVDLEKKQKELMALANASGSDADKTKAQDALKEVTALAEKHKTMWTGIGTSIGGALEKAFGRGGKAMGDLVKASVNFSKLSDKSAGAQVKYYGEAANAAKGFFKEGSTGYKTLEGVSRVFHMAEMAQTLGLINLKAIMAVMTQGGGDPYTAFARMAAMAAVVGALGFAVGGGFQDDSGGGKTAEEMQKEQGTGSVFGDAEAKSNSILAAIDAMEGNTSMMLPLTSAMLASLKNIEASMTGFTNLILRTTGLMDGSGFGIQEGTTKQSMPGAPGVKSGAAIGLMVAGPIGAVLGAVAGKIASLWGKTTTTIVDAGIQYSGRVKDLQDGLGYNSYASVDTTKSSWFGLSKKTNNDVKKNPLSDELSTQFGLIFTDLESTLKLAANSFGKTSDQVGESINNLVIQTTTLSLKGLSGKALQDEINGVISKTMDEIATAAFPAMGDFRQVGEGYAQTVIRVAAGIEQAQVALKEFGITAIDYTEIMHRTGDVAAQMIRQSIVGKESSTTEKTVTETNFFGAEKTVTHFITTLTGVGEIMQGLTGTAEELVNTYRELVTVRKSMSDTGLGTGLSIKTIEAAGGLDKLSASMTSFYDKYFSDAERLKIETANVAASFKVLGFELPKSRDQLREWITKAGEVGNQTQLGSLLALAEAFDKVAGTAGSAASAADNSKKLLELQRELLTLQGRGAEVTKAVRAEEIEALNKLDPALGAVKNSIHLLSDALQRNEAFNKTYVELLTAQGKTEEALAITRKGELEALMKVNPELLNMKQHIYRIADAVTAFKASMTVVDNAMKGVTASVDAEKKDVGKAYDKKKDLLTIQQNDESKALKDAHESTLARIKAEEAAAIESAQWQAEATNAAMKVQKEANKVLLEAAKNMVSGAERLLSSLKSAIESTTQYDQVKARSAALATVKGAAASNDSANFAGIDEALKELQKPSENLFGTMVEYQLSQAQANVELKKLETAAQAQLTDAQKQVELLTAIDATLSVTVTAVTASISAAAADAAQRQEGIYEREQEKMDKRHEEEQEKLQTQREEDIAALDLIVTKAQQQIDALNGINTSVMTLAEATAGFGSAVLAAIAAKADVEKAKDDFFVPSFSVGTNEVPQDMFAQIHKGERIIPAADNAELLRRLKSGEAGGSLSKEDLAALIASLTEVIKIGDVANVQKSNDMYRIFRDWETNGLPPTRSTT